YELRNVLSTAFLLATALLHQRRRLLAALGCFVLALLSKSAVVVYPALAWLVLPADTPRRRRLWSLVPFVVLAALMGHLAIWYEHHLTEARGSEWPQTLGERIAIAGRVFWFYLGKIVWPHPLAFAYARFQVDPHDPMAYLPALAVVATFALLFLARRRP